MLVVSLLPSKNNRTKTSTTITTKHIQTRNDDTHQNNPHPHPLKRTSCVTHPRSPHRTVHTQHAAHTAHMPGHSIRHTHLGNIPTLPTPIPTHTTQRACAPSKRVDTTALAMKVGLGEKRTPPSFKEREWSKEKSCANCARTHNARKPKMSNVESRSSKISAELTALLWCGACPHPPWVVGRFAHVPSSRLCFFPAPEERFVST